MASRWWRNKTERPPSPLQKYQKIICTWNNSHWTLPKDPDIQKGKLISSEWGPAKEKDKRETKDFTMGTPVPGRESWRRRRFHTLGNPVTGEVRGELCILRRRHSKAKQRKFTTEIRPNSNFQLRSGSQACVCLQQVRAGCGDSGFGAQSSGKGLGPTAVKILWGG